MSHKKKHKKKKDKVVEQPSQETAKKKFELVIKCDTPGCIEAVSESLKAIVPAGFQLSIIRQGVGDINQNDVAMAETGDRMIIGFNVGVLPHIEELCKLRNVDIRLYDVIYKIGEDLKNIITSFTPRQIREESLGLANVIALFKSCRGGIILGCEVKKGRLEIGADFRVISAIGPIYAGKIHSLHVEKDAVQMARPGQQVGLKIVNFNKAKIGDIVESYKLTEISHGPPWTAKGLVLHR